MAATRKVGEYFPRAWCEEHVVIGLQLQGMSKVGYIYAHDRRETDIVSAYGDMKMRPPIPFKTFLASQNQRSPDPGQLGQLSRVEAEKVVETVDAANGNFAVEHENAKMSQVIPFPNLLASPNQPYPDPDQWGQISGIKTGKAVETGYAAEMDYAVGTETAAEADVAVETDDAKISSSIPLNDFPVEDFLASPNQQHPGPGEWGQTSGVGNEDTAEREVAREAEGVEEGGCRPSRPLAVRPNF